MRWSRQCDQPRSHSASNQPWVKSGTGIDSDLEWSTYPLLKKYPWVASTLIAWLRNNCHPCLPLYGLYFSHWWIGDNRRSKGLYPWLRWVLGLPSKANTAYTCVYLRNIQTGIEWHMGDSDTYQAQLVREELNQDDVEWWLPSEELAAHYHQLEPNSCPLSNNHQLKCASNDPSRQIWWQYLDWELDGYYKLSTVGRSHWNIQRSRLNFGLQAQNGECLEPGEREDGVSFWQQF